MANIARGDDGNIARPGCRQGLGGEDRVGIQRVRVGRRHSCVADMRPEVGRSE